MIKNAPKTVLRLTLGLALLVSTTYKGVLHNIMSHHPYPQISLQELVKEPKLFLTNGGYDGIPNSSRQVPKGTDLIAVYLGLQDNPFPISEDKPTSLTGSENITFYDPLDMINLHLSEESLGNTSLEMLMKIRDLKKGEIIPLREYGDQCQRYSNNWYYGEGLVNMENIGPVEGFGNFTLSIGYDDRGKYLSFYDIFDFMPGRGGYYNDTNNKGDLEKIAMFLLPRIGKPISFYKRFYLEDYGMTEETIARRIEQNIATIFQIARQIEQSTTPVFQDP